MDAENRSDQQNNFDKWLDSALRARMDAEPRIGLEERVLERLASEPQCRFTLWPAMAMAAAAMVVIAIMLVLLRPTQPDGAIAHRAPQAGGSVVNGSSLGTNPIPKITAVHKAPHHESMLRANARCCASRRAAAHHEREETLPKLASFPAARPETEQERLLAQVAAQLAAQGQFSQLANMSLDSPKKDLAITELRIEPLEASPESSTPHQ